MDIEKILFYLTFHDDTSTESTEEVVEENKEVEVNKETTEEKVKEEEKKETKKTKTKDTVTVSKSEFEEYKKLKLSNMSSEERELALQNEIDNLRLKIDSYENIINQKNLELENIKTQELINKEIKKVETDKPYLKDVLTKRIEKGFKSVAELKEFIDVVDTDVLKNAYEFNSRTKGGNTLFNEKKSNVFTSNNSNQKNNVDTPLDLRKYGIYK